MSDEDVKATQDLVQNVKTWTRPFMTYPDESFDFLFVRHCLEHSPFPYLTLGEYKRVPKTGGKIYIEMPASDNADPLEYIPIIIPSWVQNNGRR